MARNLGDSDQQVADETTPLVHRPSFEPQLRSSGSRTRRVVVLSCLFIFLLEFGAGLQIPSIIALLEQRICYDVQPGSPWPPSPDDPTCKVLEVQGPLASLRGFQATLDVIPGLLTTIPYGALSDRWGRKPILLLATLGYTLSIAFQIFVLSFGPGFPTWLILCSTLFTFIGGSPSTMSAMMFTSIADVVPAADRANVFFAITATYIGSEIVSSPLAGLILLHSPWGLLLLSFGVLLLTGVVVLIFPETLGKTNATSTHAVDEPLQRAGPDTADSSQGHTAEWPIVKKAAVVWGHAVQNKRLLALLLSLVFVVLGCFVQEMLLQYTTERYDWSWSQASFVLTIRSISNLIVLVFIMPFFSHVLLNRYRLTAMGKDLWIARWSGLLGVAGFLLIAFAFNPAILCTGLVVVSLSGGMSSVLRSLLNSLVEPQHLGKLNSALGIMEMASLLVAAPLLSQGLRLGLNLGGAWLGLPFMCAAALMSISTCIIWLIRVDGLNLA